MNMPTADTKTRHFARGKPLPDANLTFAGGALDGTETAVAGLIVPPPPLTLGGQGRRHFSHRRKRLGLDRQQRSQSDGVSAKEGPRAERLHRRLPDQRCAYCN